MDKLHPLEILPEEIPHEFPFPFFYTPPEIAQKAARKLMSILEERADISNHLGVHNGNGPGKMFGVLVVQDQHGKGGFLAACSGKLLNSNHHDFLVPTVFDMLEPLGFYKQGEQEINAINQEIEELEQSVTLQGLRKKWDNHLAQHEAELIALKKEQKRQKKERKTTRLKALEDLAPEMFDSLNDALIQESLTAKFLLKKHIQWGEEKQKEIGSQLHPLEMRLKNLKNLRKAKSAALQEQLFQHYSFLNAAGETRSLHTIFNDLGIYPPPAGSGECCAPKLLHYAYINQLTPICMAEFWWGASPKSEVRKHQQFYPACRGKCEPILGHMLKGINLAKNPLLTVPSIGKELPVVFEDPDIIVVNKPAEFLSVPGKTISDSVYTRILQMYPDISGPVIVHRLDMSTSGILVLAKSKQAHQKLQKQFINRTVKKHYTALLEGEVQKPRGQIELPLRVDLNNRPHQLVCFEHGKKAKTQYEVLEVKDGKTRIQFFPITGRTHQLRVHAAHPLGLNAPIVGDDLYGNPEKRLHLHAQKLSFEHPRSGEKMEFEIAAEF